MFTYTNTVHEHGEYEIIIHYISTIILVDSTFPQIIVTTSVSNACLSPQDLGVLISFGILAFFISQKPRFV